MYTHTHTHTGKHALIKCVLDAYACIVGVHAVYVHVHTPTGILISLSLVVCYCREVCVGVCMEVFPLMSAVVGNIM